MIDTFQARYMMRHCKIRETPHFTSFDCPHEPTYILSRKCLPTQGGGPGPCCKVDELFTYLIMDRPDVYSHIKWAFHCDDDTFFRIDQVMRYFAKIHNTGAMTYPIVGSPNFNDPKENVYGTNECTEIHTNGWYQPFYINHAAMERVKVGFANYGTMEMCLNFDVTHDVGMGPFFWMYQLWRFPFVGQMVSNHGTDIGSVLTHAVKHAHKIDDCDTPENFGDKKYTQKMVIGCGTIEESQQNHKPGKPGENGDVMMNDMYDLWNHFKIHGEDDPFEPFGETLFEKRRVTLYPNGTMLEGVNTPGDEHLEKIKHILLDGEKADADGKFNGDPVVERVVPNLLRLAGYETTKHSKQYDIVKEWKSFKRTDCAIEGYGGPPKPKPQNKQR